MKGQEKKVKGSFSVSCWDQVDPDTLKEARKQSYHLLYSNIF